MNEILGLNHRLFKTYFIFSTQPSATIKIFLFPLNKPKPRQRIPAIWQRFLLQTCVCELIPRQCTPPLNGGGLVQLRLRDRAPPLQVALHELH